ncbi:hypothetical protein TRSC58_07593 [Trypanosoma rangeli SC58]|uniref:Uncharacterized protein n=1 Tax=Trypanosoma rangeli SC58 TaxID=429131 RepID=A0A061IUX8_TRYRA|nr:hypothetical protein TRSC58_07593 [Trypanosoma rangeli SC58]
MFFSPVPLHLLLFIYFSCCFFFEIIWVHYGCCVFLGVRCRFSFCLFCFLFHVVVFSSSLVHSSFASRRVGAFR